MIERLWKSIENAVYLLTVGRYEDLSSAGRLTACEIEKAVREYGETLGTPSVAMRELVDIVRVDGSSPVEWSVQVPLWNADGRRSDLTLELTLVETTEGIKAEVEDLHVL